MVHSIYQTANGQGKDTETRLLCAEAVACAAPTREKPKPCEGRRTQSAHTHAARTTIMNCELMNLKKVATRQPSLLGYPDSNQEKQDQNLLCYHYTISQCQPPIRWGHLVFTSAKVLLFCQPPKLFPTFFIKTLIFSKKSASKHLVWINCTNFASQHYI